MSIMTNCHKLLAEQVKALYITIHAGITLDNVAEILKPLTEAKVYTLSQLGSDEVEHGVMLSIAEEPDFPYTGRFYASTIAKVLSGAKPGDLERIYSAPAKIAINLETASLVGYSPPIDIIEAIDKFY